MDATRESNPTQQMPGHSPDSDRPGFWKGRRVLITGHTGFKGAWLTTWLLKLGCVITGLALEPHTFPSMFESLGLGRSVDSRIGDIRNARFVETVIEDADPEVVIHMAAQSLVRRSYDDPSGTFMTNVMGTVHLLEAARRASKLRSIVIVTSDKCYENREWTWGYRESDALGGHDPYSASKGCAELVTASYRRCFGERMFIASARAGNVIGGGDWSDDRLIPDVIRSLVSGKPLDIRNPGAIRPWQHVLEPLYGYLSLAERLYTDGPSFAGAWNFGPNIGDTLPVAEVVNRMNQKLGTDAVWRYDGRDHPHEANFLKLDISKAVGELGYRPRVSLEMALDWTAEWYRAFLDKQDMVKITHDQIDRFDRLGKAERSTANGLIVGPVSNDARFEV